MAQVAQNHVLECGKLFEANKTTEALEKLQVLKREIAGFKSNSALLTKDILNHPDLNLERQVTIKTLELGAFLAIKVRDLDLFDRHVTQLKTYYHNFPLLAVQGSASCLLGLNLLHLLASDRRGEFHQELELLSKDLRNVSHIEHPVLLERYLMEGNYAKILEVVKQLDDVYKEVPKVAEIKVFFGERLAETVRARVAESLEKSYKSLQTSVAVKMLSLKNLDELKEFAKSENSRKKSEEDEDMSMGDATPGILAKGALRIRWEIIGDQLCFSSDSDTNLDIPALSIINNTIGYATDLERIV